MAEIPDITSLSPDETSTLLEKHGKPLLCMVPWDRIDFIQSRVTTDPALVAEYEESLGNGDNLPPSKGIYIPELNISKLFDGIHSATGRHNLGQLLIPVFLQVGTNTDAEIAAAGANHSNGARRSNADKRHAVAILLRNPELCGRSNNWLAKVSRVSPALVEEVRVELESDPVNPISRPKKRLVTRNGVEYETDAPSTSAESPKKAAVISPKKLVQGILGSLDKQLEKQPAEQHAPICEELIAIIHRDYLLG